MSVYICFYFFTLPILKKNTACRFSDKEACVPPLLSILTYLSIYVVTSTYSI